MRVTIIQLDASRLESEWRRLLNHLAQSKSQFLLLPEMCFAPWFCAETTPLDTVWQSAVAVHDTWLARLPELPVDIVAGTAPRNIDDKRQNFAWVWTRREGMHWVHAKTYLPNDDGYWEATWYDRGPVSFQAVRIDELTLGFMICTEIWFLQHARGYGKQGVRLLLNPRSTPRHTNAKWLACGQTAAVVSGAYCLSSNHAGKMGGVDLGGAGWLTDPDGAILTTTNDETPFVTTDINLALADQAKFTYPRYVDDSPI